MANLANAQDVTREDLREYSGHVNAIAEPLGLLHELRRGMRIHQKQPDVLQRAVAKIIQQLIDAMERIAPLDCDPIRAAFWAVAGPEFASIGGKQYDSYHAAVPTRGREFVETFSVAAGSKDPAAMAESWTEAYRVDDPSTRQTFNSLAFDVLSSEMWFPGVGSRAEQMAATDPYGFDAEWIARRLKWEAEKAIDAALPKRGRVRDSSEAPSDGHAAESQVRLAGNERIAVDLKNSTITIDGTCYPSIDSIVNWTHALIQANGQPVAASKYGVRTRDKAKLPAALKALIEQSNTTKPPRIPPERLRKAAH